MAMHGGEGHVPGRTEFKKGGWGVAIGVSALAVALSLSAFAIHRATYHDPFDPLSPSEGRAEAAHGAPAEGAEAHGETQH